MSNRASHKDLAKISSWGRFWRCLGLSWVSFGLLLDSLGWLRALLGASWAPLGHLLGALGRLLAALWSFLAAFWLPRPPRASILEGLGWIFQGFGRRERCLRAFPGWRTLCHQLVLHHWAVRGRKVAEILPSHGTSASNACASVSWRRWARCSRSGVAGGVPPLGAFNGIETVI